MRRGDEPAAARHQAAALELAVQLGVTVMVAYSLIVAARIEGSHGEWSRAVTLHAAADRLLEETGAALYDDDRRMSDAMLEEARARLGRRVRPSQRRGASDRPRYRGQAGRSGLRCPGSRARSTLRLTATSFQRERGRAMPFPDDDAPAQGRWERACGVLTDRRSCHSRMAHRRQRGRRRRRRGADRGGRLRARPRRGQAIRRSPLHPAARRTRRRPGRGDRCPAPGGHPGPTEPRPLRRLPRPLGEPRLCQPGVRQPGVRQRSGRARRLRLPMLLPTSSGKSLANRVVRSPARSTPTRSTPTRPTPTSIGPQVSAGYRPPSAPNLAAWTQPEAENPEVVVAILDTGMAREASAPSSSRATRATSSSATSPTRTQTTCSTRRPVTARS